MFANKVVITEDTMNKAQKKLTNRRKGELRLQRLRELSESGKLAMIKSRADLAMAVGFTYDQRFKGGSQWVVYNVKKGIIRESLVGYTNHGTAEYEYHFVEPDTIKKAPRKNAKKTVEKSEPNTLVDKIPTPIITDTSASEVQVLAGPQVLTVYKGETTITLENVDKDTAVEIIKSIF